MKLITPIPVSSTGQALTFPRQGGRDFCKRLPPSRGKGLLQASSAVKGEGTFAIFSAEECCRRGYRYSATCVGGASPANTRLNPVHRPRSLSTPDISAASADGPLSPVAADAVSAQLRPFGSYRSETPIWSSPPRPSFTSRSMLMKPSSGSRFRGMLRDVRITPQSASPLLTVLTVKWLSPISSKPLTW